MILGAGAVTGKVHGRGLEGVGSVLFPEFSGSYTGGVPTIKLYRRALCTFLQ